MQSCIHVLEWRATVHPDVMALADDSEPGIRTLSCGRRGRVSERAIDPLSGGHFVVTDADGRTVTIGIGPDVAPDFLSLRNGDMVELTWTADRTGIESFDHICLANGAVPRNPAGQGSVTGQVILQ